jgi:hypothetical protein
MPFPKVKNHELVSCERLTSQPQIKRHWYGASTQDDSFFGSVNRLEKQQHGSAMPPADSRYVGWIRCKAGQHAQKPHPGSGNAIGARNAATCLTRPENGFRGF